MKDRSHSPKACLEKLEQMEFFRRGMREKAERWRIGKKGVCGMMHATRSESIVHGGFDGRHSV